MTIISWNVNGIRAAVRKGFPDFLKKYQPDILLLQETKISDLARDKTQFDFKDYEEFWNPAEKSGYSGTAILARRNNKKEFSKNLIKVTNGFGQTEFDNEGRVQVIELKKLFIINSYFPNSNHELSRLSFKLRFNDCLLDFMNELIKKKPVIIGGDFNVAPQDLDLANPRTNKGNAGFTDEERDWIDKMKNFGYIDMYRKFHHSRVQYTWWSQRFNARPRNIGWRIDHFFASEKAVKYIKKCEILDKITGSDHCPILIAT